MFDTFHPVEVGGREDGHAIPITDMQHKKQRRAAERTKQERKQAAPLKEVAHSDGTPGKKGSQLGRKHAMRKRERERRVPSCMYCTPNNPSGR